MRYQRQKPSVRGAPNPKQVELMGFMARGVEYDLDELAENCCLTRRDARENLTLLRQRGHIKRVIRYVRVTDGPKKCGRASGYTAAVWATLGLVSTRSAATTRELWEALPPADDVSLDSFRMRLVRLRKDGWITASLGEDGKMVYLRSTQPLPPGVLL